MRNSQANPRGDDSLHGRKKFNAARHTIGGVLPQVPREPLPPQPSILPAPVEPFIVQIARRVDTSTRQFKPFRKALRLLRRSNLKAYIADKAHRAFSELSVPSSEAPTVSIIIPVFNKVSITLSCLESLAANLPSTIACEIIVVDNASTDDSKHLPKVSGLRYMRNKNNEGFVGGCNIGARSATGTYLVFLNNDAVTTPGWLESLVKTIESYPRVGIVGSKIIYPDGRLQEAGGIIYRDGTGCNYGKNDHPDRYQYNYVREVDYCSGASIIIRKDLFTSFGGFDELYAPAYYEDTDLAFKVRDMGLKVIYQPQSVIYHIEGATAGTNTSSGFKKYQAINHKKFLKRWNKTLKTKHLTTKDQYLARDRSGQKLVLIVDEFVPKPDIDSGSVRMSRLIDCMQALGYKVTIFPVSGPYDNYTKALQQKGVEVVYGPVEFTDFISLNGKYYDDVILSRPRVGSFFIDLCQAYCTKARIIYDTVDLHYLRLGRQSEFETNTELKQYFKDAAQTHEYIEKQLMAESDIVIVVSDAERELLAREHITNVEVLSNVHTVQPDAYEFGFDQRKDIVFVGGFSHLPNVDAIQWFVDAIYPHVQKQLPSINLHVIGSQLPTSLEKYLNSKSGVVVHGYVTNEKLFELLTKSRLFVAPLRYGAGVKGKIGQAIEYGLPVVTTTIGAEGMHMEDDRSAFVADKPRDFADKIVTAYSSRDKWGQVQQNAKGIIERYFSLDTAKEALARVLR